MFKHICDIISGLLIFAKHALDKVDALVAHTRPNWSFKLRFLVQYSLLYFIDRRPYKGHLATDKVVKNTAQTPNITLEVTRLPKQNLRCFIPKSTCIFNESFLFLQEACQTKVSNLDLWSLVSTAQKDVLMLYISVHNVLSVNILQSIGNLCENVECVLLRKVILAVSLYIDVQVLPFFI